MRISENISLFYKIHVPRSHDSRRYLECVSKIRVWIYTRHEKKKYKEMSYAGIKSGIDFDILSYPYTQNKIVNINTFFDTFFMKHLKI